MHCSCQLSTYFLIVDFNFDTLKKSAQHSPLINGVSFKESLPLVPCWQQHMNGTQLLMEAIFVAYSSTYLRPEYQVPHIPLLDSLAVTGINPQCHVLNWLKDYLCQSQPRDLNMVNDECSSIANFIFGVPQGSKLGPLHLYEDGLTQLPLRQGSHSQRACAPRVFTGLCRSVKV